MGGKNFTEHVYHHLSGPLGTGHVRLALTSSLRRWHISFTNKEIEAVNSKRISELEPKCMWLRTLYTVTNIKFAEPCANVGCLVQSLLRISRWQCCEYHSTGPWESAGHTPMNLALAIHPPCLTQMPNRETPLTSLGSKLFLQSSNNNILSP